MFHFHNKGARKNMYPKIEPNSWYSTKSRDVEVGTEVCMASQVSTTIPLRTRWQMINTDARGFDTN